MTPCLLLPVIAFNKGTFCRYFEKGENYFWFHQFIARVLQALTSEVAKLIQDKIVAKLIMKGNFVQLNGVMRPGSESMEITPTPLLCTSATINQPESSITGHLCVVTLSTVPLGNK